MSKKALPLSRFDALRFHHLLMQRRSVEAQLLALDVAREMLWLDIEERYQAKGYILDLEHGVLVPSAEQEVQ